MAANTNLLCDKFSFLYQNRQCNQKDQTIQVCKYSTDKIYLGYFEKLIEFDGINSENFCEIPFLELRREFRKTVINSEIFLVGGCNLSHLGYLDHIEIYSKKTKKWRLSTKWPGSLFGFCVTSFKRNVFVIGGSNFGNPGYTNACLKYDVQQDKWSYVASMNGKRIAAACTVFDGKIVVSGGNYNHQLLKSVEAYDYHGNKWTRLPDMLEKRSQHFLKSLGNKMFVMSRFLDQRCKIFDSVSRKFSYVKASPFSKRLNLHF